MNKKIPVVSFFCGCGGLDLGLIGGFTYKGSDIKKLPFTILKAYDNNEKCIETYKKNISEHARCHRTSFAEDQDRDHWRKPGDRADALLQGHLRPNSAGKDDRLHFAKRRKQSTASGLCRYRGCRGRCHGAEFLFHGSAAEAGTA